VLAQLPDGQRTVLILHDVEGYTHAEIGQMLGVAEGTSKSQLSAARKQAQALYDGGSHE
jgi:RNA polymerase sigma-70 factor (ECF subfamily)